MSYEKLKGQSVEPLILADLQIDEAVTNIEDFETLSVDEYSNVSNIELDTSNASTGNSSLSMDVSRNKMLFDFENVDEAIGYTAATNITSSEDIFFQGTKCLKFDKNTVSRYADIDIPNPDEYVFRDYQAMGMVSFMLWVDSESDAQKIVINDSLFVCHNPARTEFVYWRPINTNIKMGWNNIKINTSAAPTTSAGFLNDEIVVPGLRVYTNNASDTLTDLRMDCFRIYEGPDSYIEETIEDFSDHTEWFGAGCNLVGTTGNVRTGSSSTWMQKTSTTIFDATMTKSVVLDMSRSGIAKISFYVDEASVSKISMLRFGLWKDGSTVKFWNFDVLKAGWNTAYINLWFADRSIGYYSYQGLQDVISLDITIRSVLVTDTPIVEWDGITFPGESANAIDLPSGIFLDKDTITGVLAMNNEQNTTDLTGINSRRIFEFDSDNTNVDAYMNTSLAHDSSLSDQCEIRDNLVMAYDYLYPSADITKMSYMEFKRNNLTNLYNMIPIDGISNVVGYTDWNTFTTNINTHHYKTTALAYLTFHFFKNNTTDVVTGTKLANFRTVKQDNKFYGKLQAGDFKRWNYGTSGEFKPIYWAVSDLTMLLEPNARPCKHGNSLRVNNTDLVNDITLSQQLDYNTSGDLQITVNTKGSTTFSAWVYCENVGVVSLSLEDNDDVVVTGSANKYAEQWELITCEMPSNGITAMIDNVDFVISKESGDVDICYPKLVPSRFGNQADYFVIDDMQDVNKFQKWETLNGLNFGTGHFARIEINHYCKYGMSFSDAGGFNRSLDMVKELNISLMPHQRILLDVYIKDSATLTKISHVIITQLRDIPSTYTVTDEHVMRKSTINYNLQIGWNTVSFYPPEYTFDNYENGDVWSNANSPSAIMIGIWKNIPSDTLAIGDVIFSNLRCKNGEPFQTVYKFDDSISWTGPAIEIETDNVYAGDSCFKLTMESTGPTTTFQSYTRAVALDLSDLETIFIPVYSDDFSNLNYIRFRFGNGFINYIYYDADATTLKDGEWNLIRINLAVMERNDSSGLGDTLVYRGINSATISTMTINLNPIAAGTTEILVDGIYSDNYIPLPYLSGKEVSNFSVSSGDSFIKRTSGGYLQQGCLEVVKGAGHAEFGWHIDETITRISLRRNKKIYMPVFIPSSEHGKIELVRLLMSKELATGNIKEVEVLIADITPDEWNLLEFDFECDLCASQPNDLVLNRLFYGRINCVGTDALSGVLIGAVTTECTKFSQGGFRKVYNAKITDGVNISFKMFVPSIDVIESIGNINLTVNNNIDFSDSRFYKKDNSELSVGWNLVTWNLLEDVFIDTKNTAELSPDIHNFKIYVENVNPSVSLQGIHIDRLATYDVATDEIIRASKIDIIGSSNGKHWEGRLLKVGTITRTLSGQTGIPDLPSTTIELSDTDDKISDLYVSTGGASNFRNNEVNLSIGSQDYKESEFISMYKGYINDIKFSKKTARITATDTFESYLVDLPRAIVDNSYWTEVEDGDNGKQCPTIYGEVLSSVGALPLLNVGEHTTHVIWYIVAGHACKRTPGVTIYHDGEIISGGYSIDYAYVLGGETFCVVKVNMVEQTDAVDSGNNEWKNPWEDDITNIDSGGNDVIVSVAPEKIACNAYGKTIDGGINSDILDDVTDVIYNVLTREMKLPSERINISNFQEIQAIMSSNAQKIAGAIVENENAEEVIKDMLMSHNLSMFIDKNGLVNLYYFEAQKSDELATLYTDEVDIIKGSFVCDTGVDLLVNRIRFRCNFNYTDYYKDDEASWEFRDTVQDEDSITGVGKFVDWDDDFLNMKWVRSGATGNLVSQRLLNRYKNGRPGAKLSLPLAAYTQDLAERIKITHYDGVSIDRVAGTTGWASHLCVIKSVQLNPDKVSVTLTVDNVQDLASNCNYLGDRDTFIKDPALATVEYPLGIPSWLTAISDLGKANGENAYMYLADRDGDTGPIGKFSNGDTPSGLC